MLAESNFPVSFDLLEPRQPVAVGGDAGDHVVQPVAIHVVHQHLRAPGPESIGMFLPVRLCIAKVAARATNDLRFAVAGHIRKAGRLVIKFIEDDMALPMSFAAFGVFIPSRLLAWEPIDQNIHPAIAIEVIDKTEEVVRVHIVGPQSAFEACYGFLRAVGFLASKSGIGGIKLVAFLELGAFIPVGTANNVHLSVAVKIAEVGALSPKFIVKLGLLKNVERVIRGG